MSGLPEGHSVRVFSDRDTLFSEAASILLTSLRNSGSYPRFVLAGGSTPVAVYQQLAAAGAGDMWSRMRVTFSDERAVGPEDEASNYGMARRVLLDPLGVSADRVLRIRGEDGAGAAADKAHKRLLDWAQRVPLFDVVLLGQNHRATVLGEPVYDSANERLRA